jgi:DNA-binding NarL/FixJ family response regulator
MGASDWHGETRGTDEVAIRVFLVEDMPQVRGILTDLLAGLGDFPVVHVTGTEAEAKLWLKEHPAGWDLAIVDLVLDQGSGFAVVPIASQQARQNGGKVVVFSDYASGGIRAHCEKLGADAVFLKSEMREFMDYCSRLGGQAATPSP